LVHQKVENAKHQILAQAAAFARVPVREINCRIFSLRYDARPQRCRDLLGGFGSQRR
jgi:hypothetical protein